MEMENGKWKVESGKWKVESGKWKMENGKWKMEMHKVNSTILLAGLGWAGQNYNPQSKHTATNCVCVSQFHSKS